MPPLECGTLLIASEGSVRGGWDRKPRPRHSRKLFLLLLLDDEFAILPLMFAVTAPHFDTIQKWSKKGRMLMEMWQYGP